MRKWISLGLLLCLYAGFACPALGDEWNGYPTGLVLCETLSLRTSPDSASTVLTTLDYGQRLTIINTSDPWMEVSCALLDPETGMVTATYRGWVRGEYVLEEPTFFTPAQETPVFALPATDAKRVALLDAASGPYPIIAEYEGYLAISLRGASGFVEKPAP